MLIKKTKPGFYIQELQTVKEKSQVYYLPMHPRRGNHLPASLAQPHQRRFSSGCLAGAAPLPKPHLPGQAQAVLRFESRAKQMSSAPERRENHHRSLTRMAFCLGDVFLKFAHTYEKVCLNLLLNSPDFYSTLPLTTLVRQHFSLLP